MRCTSFCTADAYRLSELLTFLREEGFDPHFYDDVVHLPYKQDNYHFGDVFFFAYGCVITWGLSIPQEQTILSLIKTFESDPLFTPVEDYATYRTGDAIAIHEEEDEIILKDDDLLVKLSFSHGFSQSVKLSTFEESTDRTITKTRHIPLELAQKGKISLSRKKLSQKMGELFAERTSVMLHTDILDTPEFFWRRSRYEPYYQMATEYMDIAQRMDVLNKRLDVIYELYGILSNELNHAHSSRLELTIIYLIVIEVVLVIIKDFLNIL